MNNTVKTILSFVIGAAAGASVTYFVTNKKAQEFAEDEISKVRLYYRKKEKEEKEKVQEEQKTYQAEKEAPAEVEKKIFSMDREEEAKRNPYPITPDEFGELEDYDALVLLYSGGKISVTRDGGKTTRAVSNYKEMIGNAFSNWIGMYEDNVAYIRNDRLKQEYKVITSEYLA